MKKILLFLLGLVCILSSCQAQPPSDKTTATPLSKITPLTIGDTVPNIILHHMLNYSGPTARLSDFKGKPIILDFFATWCGSCIKALFELDSLQKKFKDQIQIIIVTSQSLDKISSFLHHNPNAQDISLPFVTGDSLLSQYFPHKMIPHDIWIDKHGQVDAITEYYYITAANLRDLLNDSPLHLPIKKDILNFTTSTPLFLNYQNNNRDLYYSIFGRFIKGVPSLVIKFKKESNSVKFFATNTPIIGLFQAAIPDLDNRIILQVRDTSCYIWNRYIPYEQWAIDNCFCYEISVPPSTTKEELQRYILQDLSRYLGLSISRKKQIINCWALIQTDHKPLFHTQGGKPEYNLLNRTLPVKIFRNLPVSKLITVLNYQAPADPISPIIIDETHYAGNIDLKLKVNNIHNIPALRKALQPYGLDLIPVKRKLEMFMLTEDDLRNNSPINNDR